MGAQPVDKAIDGDAAAHEQKSPQGVNRAGLEELHPAINPDGLVAQDLSPIPKQSGKF